MTARRGRQTAAKPKPDESKPDESKPDESKPDESKPDESPDDESPDDESPNDESPDNESPDESGDLLSRLTLGDLHRLRNRVNIELAGRPRTEEGY